MPGVSAAHDGFYVVRIPHCLCRDPQMNEQMRRHYVVGYDVAITGVVGGGGVGFGFSRKTRRYR